jgi:hypothetical protein
VGNEKKTKRMGESGESGESKDERMKGWMRKIARNETQGKKNTP